MTQNTSLAPISSSDIALDFPKLTAKQVLAVEYLALGFSISRVANIVKVSPSLVRTWATDNEGFQSAVERAKNTVAAWEANVLKESVIMAHKKIGQILEQNYETASSSERKEIARTARFVVETSSGVQRGNVTTNVFSPQMHISDPSADIIARRVKELDLADIPPTLQTTYSIKEVPRSYVTHPDTDYGVLNHNEEDDTYQCHICGKWYDNLYQHTELTHKLTRFEYREAFGIQE